MVGTRVIHPDALLRDLLVNLRKAPVAPATANEVRTRASDFSPRVVATRRRAPKWRRIRDAHREEFLPIDDQRPGRCINPNRHLRNRSPRDQHPSVSSCSQRAERDRAVLLTVLPN